ELKIDQELVDHAIKSEQNARIKAMIDLACSEPGIPILPAEMDSDPWALNCLNGTLDLRTGELRAHRREDLLTKLCPVEYHADAACPTWEASLHAIFAGKQAFIDYTRRLFGYFLTGDVSEQILAIAWGAGSNGKSTLLNILIAMLGEDY